jgi:hypothetical protein
MTRGAKRASSSAAISTCGGSANEPPEPAVRGTREAWTETPLGAIACISDSGTGSKSGVSTPIRPTEPRPSGRHRSLRANAGAGARAKIPPPAKNSAPLRSMRPPVRPPNTADKLRAPGARRRAGTRSALLRVPWGRSEGDRQLHPLVGRRDHVPMPRQQGAPSCPFGSRTMPGADEPAPPTVVLFWLTYVSYTLGTRSLIAVRISYGIVPAQRASSSTVTRWPSCSPIRTTSSPL